MSQISVSNLTFYYDGSYDTIFEDVSFQIDSNWKLGFIGRNGRGKTTFLRLLMKEYEYRGSISSNLQFDYFPYTIPKEMEEKNTIELVEFIHPDYELWRLCRELTQMEVDTEILYRPYATLSKGEQNKVTLALLFSNEHNFLLIDEPTNHLDIEARKTVREYLNTKKGFILVSHDRWFLDGCIDHVLVINKNNIQVEKGNFSSWWDNKQKQDQYEIAENEKLKGDIKKLKTAAKQRADWADKVESTKIGFNPIKEDRNISTRAYIGAKTKSMQKLRKNLEHRQEQAIEEKEKLLKNIETTDNLKLFPLKHHKEVLIRAEELAIYYGGRKVTEAVNFTLRSGDRLVLQGRNGCGKSSIIKKILGEEIQTAGRLEIASGLKISYVSQDTSHLSGTLEEYAGKQGIDETLFKTLLRKLDLERVQFEKRIEEYSSGQKKKVLIAGSLCEKAHLYIWDEPLNYVDIFSRMQIEKLIKEYTPTMILVEHDEFFTEQIGTGILKM